MNFLLLLKKHWKVVLFTVILLLTLTVGCGFILGSLACSCISGVFGLPQPRGFGNAGETTNGIGTPGGGGTVNKDCIEKINSNAKKYIDIVNAAAAKYGVDPTLITAIIDVESDWDPSKTNSKSGAMGMMQFLPSTWAEEKMDANGDGKADPYDPYDNIYAGARYLKKRIQWAGGNVWEGVKGYGEGTEDYVNKVKTEYERYKKCLSGGNGGQCETGREINKIVLHWTGGTYTPGTNEPYHVVIGGNGEVVKQHPYNEVVSHASGANTGTIGISMASMAIGQNGWADTGCYKDIYGKDCVPNYTKYPPTPAQVQALACTVAQLAKCYNIPLDTAHIITHADVAMDNNYFPERWDLAGDYNGSCKYTRTYGGKKYCIYSGEIVEMAKNCGQAPTPTAGGKVALTFDDGPSTYSSQIVNILKQNNINATFFEVGNKIGLSTVSAESAAGNAIGNHTYDHPQNTNNSQGGLNFYQLSADKQKEEISKTNDLLKKAVSTINWFRPPGGHAAKPEVLQQFGLQQICWDIDSNDWQAANADEIVNNVLNNLSNNAVILMHDGSSNSAKTVEALPKIIKGIKDKGYQMVPLSQIQLSEKVKKCYQF